MEWKLETLSYPLSALAQQELIGLLRTEWTRTDYDWLEAMNGDYSKHLVIISVLARRRGEPLGTATIHFSRQRPAVAVIGGVLTHRSHRDRGLAGRMLEAVLDQAKAAGCKVCLLGTARSPHNVYKHHGFSWQNGRVMRCPFGPGEFESLHFAPGQAAVARHAHWGDLPGLTLLAAQPVAMRCLDYPRGLFSGRYLAAERCLSNFPVLWYDTVAREGALAVLAGPDQDRVFGFGSVTLSANPARRHAGLIDVAVHDHYEAQSPGLLDFLLDACRARKLARAEAVAVATDQRKLECLRQAGFKEIARLAGALRLDDKPADSVLLDRAL